MANDSNKFLPMLIILIIIPVGIFWWWKKRKKQQNEPTPIKNKKTSSENEAWQTVKKYLKEKNEYGKEIVNLFAVKRKTSEELKKESKEFKEKYKNEQKLKKEQLKKLKVENPEEYKKLKRKERKQKPPELWILVFTTKDTKTNKLDKERMIEAEIIYEKVSKKQTIRKISYHDNINYDEEIKWIKPLKDKEEKQRIKQEKINASKKAKKEKREKQKKNKK